MNLSFTSPSRKAQAFTMIELALCIAIVAIAMVAIIGILPSGLTVQQQNREEAIIAKEAQLLLDAIRNGNTSLNSLTNFVDSIRLVRQFENLSPVTNDPSLYSGIYDPRFALTGVPGGSTFYQQGLIDASRIIGLISRPKYELVPISATKSIRATNTVYVYMRASSGPVTERPYMGPAGDVPYAGTTRDQTSRYLEPAFHYRATVEITTVYSNPFQNPPQALSDVQITLNWPVIYLPVIGADGFQKVRIGPNTRTFRAQVEGDLVRLTGTNSDIPDLSAAYSTNSLSYPTRLYRFQPGTL